MLNVLLSIFKNSDNIVNTCYIVIRSHELNNGMTLKFKISLCGQISLFLSNIIKASDVTYIIMFEQVIFLLSQF